MSPTQRTLAKLRAEGWELVAITEKWNPHARIRQDLFGVIDVLAVNSSGEVAAIQTTSGGNVSARLKKIAESDAYPYLINAGWSVIVHGWGKYKLKRGGKAIRWRCRSVNVYTGEESLT